MPIQNFSSFEAFFDANRHASLRAMLLGPERRSWALTVLVVNKLSVQWGQAGGKAVVEGAANPGGLTIFLQTKGTPAFSGNGRRIDALSVMVAGPGEEFCLASEASPRSWCSVYVPNEDLSGANGDTKATVSSLRGVIPLPSYRIDGVRFIANQLYEAVQRAPDAFNSAAAQKAVQQKLVREVRTALTVPCAAEPTIGRRALPPRQIIRMAMDFVDQHDGEYLCVEQLASAAGVSERTLRDTFQRYFGLAPVQYLNRRTLHQVRRALKAADPSVATVAEIAARFGVWQFGRFARDYRVLFTELPSETLHRPKTAA